MTYEIIKDYGILEDFIAWLPELKKDEVFLVSLFARRKYLPEEQKKLFPSDKGQLKRFTATKELIVPKLKQLEIKEGNYITGGVSIPNICLTPYISINPRSQIKANKRLLTTLIDKFTLPYDGYNVHQLALTAIHKSIGTKYFLDFDFDIYTRDEKECIIAEVQTYINKEALYILDTKGGIHIIIDLKKVSPLYIKSWYKNITAIEGCDVRGDNLIPIPGCNQGGYIPTLYQL